MYNADGTIDHGKVVIKADQMMEDVTDALINAGFNWDDELMGWVLGEEEQ